MARRNMIMVSKTLYQIGLMTAITAIIWVAIGIYSAITKTTLTEVDKTVLEPITVGIDKNVLNQLSTRKMIEVNDTIEESSL